MTLYPNYHIRWHGRWWERYHWSIYLYISNLSVFFHLIFLFLFLRWICLIISSHPISIKWDEMVSWSSHICLMISLSIYHVISSHMLSVSQSTMSSSHMLSVSQSTMSSHLTCYPSHNLPSHYLSHVIHIKVTNWEKKTKMRWDEMVSYDYLSHQQSLICCLTFDRWLTIIKEKNNEMPSTIYHVIYHLMISLVWYFCNNLQPSDRRIK